MRDYSKGAIVYQAETSYAEAGAVTPAWRLDHLGELDLGGIGQAMLDPGRMVQLANECTGYVLGPHDVAFTTRHYLAGRGSTSDGANSALGTLLSYAIGMITRTGDADPTCSAGWDADDGEISLADGSLADGGVLWVGALNDARGNGHPSVVGDHTVAQLDLGVALPAAPAENDVITVAENIHPAESPGHDARTVTGLRMGLYTADQQYVVHGCFASAVRITGTNPTEHRVVEIDWMGSWFEEADVTFPVATATSEFEPLPNAAGMMFLQEYGTASRSGDSDPIDSPIREYRQLSIDLQLGVVPQPGPGGASPFARFGGAPRRTTDVMMITVVEDTEPEATTESELRAMFEASKYGGLVYHLLIGLTNGANQFVAIRSPCVRFVDKLTRVNVNGISGMQYVLRCSADPAGATELEKAAYIIALG